MHAASSAPRERFLNMVVLDMATGEMQQTPGVTGRRRKSA
jgi:hypothetical protein